MDSFVVNDLTIKPLSGGFGAEVEGVDFSQPVPQDTIETLLELQDRFAVTIYRKTAIDNDKHVAFAAQLGKALEKNPVYAMAQRLGTPYLFDVGNIELDGSVVKKGSRRWHHALGNALWHTDSSYSAPRAKYSLLCCHAGAVPGVANTWFADTRRAYDGLPESKKAALEDLIVEHDLWYSRKLASPVFYAEPTEEEKKAKPPSCHKLVQTGPDGRKVLYLAKHAKRILGMSEEDGQKLIKELMDHCTQPQYTFQVEWKNSGDLVWWDNRQSMHRATLFDGEGYARDVRRATVVDDGPFALGVPMEESVAVDKGQPGKIRIVKEESGLEQHEAVLAYARST